MRSFFFWNLLDLSNLLRIANIGWTNYMSATHGRVIMCYGEPGDARTIYPALERERRWRRRKGKAMAPPRIGIYVSPDGITMHYIGSYALLYDTH
jgi:hypothetical protein